MPGMVGESVVLLERVLEGGRREQADAEQPVGSDRGVLLREPVVVAPDDADVRLAGHEVVERPLALHGRVLDLGPDAVAIHLRHPLGAVAGAGRVLVVGDGSVPPRAGHAGGEVGAEGHRRRGVRQRPGVTPVVEPHHGGHELPELGVDVRAPPIGRQPCSA